MDVGELFRGGTLDMSAEPWPALAAGAAAAWFGLGLFPVAIITCAVEFLAGLIPV